MLRSCSKSVFTLKTVSPFICRFIPFVCQYSAAINPFVCKKIPFVRFNAYGFTLVELIVAITIIGILSALAAPGMNSIIKNQRLTSQANELVADLNFARSEAVKRATWITICKSTNPNAANPACDTTASSQWTAGRIIFVDSGSVTGAAVPVPIDGNGEIDTGEIILRIRQGLEGGNKLHGDNTYTGTTTGTANRITYLATGMTNLVPKTGTPGDSENQLLLCDDRGPSQARRITVNTTGRVRVTKTDKNLDGSALSCP